MTARSRVDFVILLALPIIAGGFSAYEMAGLTPEWLSWHTLSYSAQHNFALALGIGVAAAVALVGFEVWWWRHMHSSIPK